MTELAFRSATALAAALRARKIGCRELLEYHLSRVEQHNRSLSSGRPKTGPVGRQDGGTPFLQGLFSGNDRVR